jgi:hypothetical protein
MIQTLYFSLTEAKLPCFLPLLLAKPKQAERFIEAVTFL